MDNLIIEKEKKHFPKKKLFKLLKAHRSKLDILNNELNLLNELFFNNEYYIDVNLKNRNVYVYNDNNLPEKDLNVSDFDKNLLDNLLKQYKIKFNLNKI